MGSKGTNTTTTNTQAPAYLQNAYSGLVGQAQSVAQTPYQPYTGELVAGVNPQEQAGIGAVNQYANFAQPYINAAAGYANSAAAPITQQQIQQYANPYTSQVAGATEQQFANLNAQQNQNVVGNAISSGAWGGDRASVAQSELAGQQASAEAPVLAGIASTGYQQGVSTALTEQQQQAQAAYSLGNLGTAGQNAGLTGAGAQIQGGQLQQGTQQQLDTAQMQQYLTSLAYPYQQLSWLGGLETGVGGVAGGTSSTTAPAPNPLNTVLGLGATAAGAYMGAAKGGRIPGIHVPHFDAGGATPYSGGIGFIPAAQQSSGRGLLNPSMMLMYGQHGQQGQQQPQPGLGGLGSGIGKRLGQSGGISADPAGAGFPQEGSADAASLDSVVPMTSEGFGIGVATGGAIHARRGFADGGGPSFDDQWGSLAGLGIGAPTAANVPLPAPRPSADVDNPDSAYNRGLVPRPTVGYSGTDMAASVDAGDISLNGGSGGLGIGAPYEATNPALEADAGGKSGTRASAYAPVAGINVPSALNPSGGVGSSAYPSFEPPEDTRSLGQKLSLPLMQAGFAMMASRSPFLGEAIGQGGLSGIGAYVNQEKEARTVQEKQQEIGLRAKQLSDLAEQHRDTLAQQEKHQQQQVGLETKKEEFTENQPRVVPMGAQLVAPQGPNAGKVIAANTASILNPNAVEIGARRLASGDASALSGLPQGTAGAAARAALANRAADIRINEMGEKPEDAAAFVTAATQQVHAAGIGMGAEARTAGTREANLNLILATTNSAIPAALEASKAVSRTGWVPINSLIQKGEVIASDPDLKAFGMANLQLAEGWARAMNATGVMRESDRDKALSFLSTTDSPSTYERAVKQLQTQIQRERDAVHSQRPATPGGSAPSEAPAGGTSAPSIPPPAIEHLRANPALRADFDAKYGAGASAQYVGGP